MDPQAVIPYVTETSARGERTLDIYSLLLRERIIFLSTPINDQIANLIITQLLYLEREDSDKDITIYVNSPGGSVSATLAMYDTMQLIKCDVSTVCVGIAASGASVILMGGTKGKRYILPHSEVMIHQPWGGIQGQATDVAIHAKEILRLQEELNQIISKHTGQEYDKVAKDTDRDLFLSAEQAVEYGIVDEILKKKERK